MRVVIGTFEVLSGGTTKDVNAHVIMMAQMVKRLYDSILDSRYAGKWSYINMFSGSRVSVKLGDALTGFNHVHPKLADLDFDEFQS
jgi:hypothetical protein